MVIDTEWIGRHNYELNSATVLRDVYRLLTMVLADDRIATAAGNAHDPLAQLRGQFVEDELIHLLIGTAVVNRLQDDHMRGPREDDADLAFQPLRHECGTLRPNAHEEGEVPLNFREACNKIIHAVHITAETEEREGAAFRILPPTVILQGEHNGRAWIAHLNLFEYARASVRNFDFG